MNDYTDPDKSLHPDNVAHNEKTLNYIRSSTSSAFQQKKLLHANFGSSLSAIAGISGAVAGILGVRVDMA